MVPLRPLVFFAARQKAQIQLEAKNRKYSQNNVNKANVNKVIVQVNDNKVNVKVNVNKVNDKVNDIYSMHSHYSENHRRGAAAEGRGTSFVVARPQAAPPL